MDRTGKDKEIHDTMVKIRANNLKNDGYSIEADINGYNTPKEINGHIPDIVATKRKEKIIVEVETCDSYSSNHTKSQYESFDKVTDAEFHVKIPESCLKEAKNKAKEWKISVDKWWYQEGY